MSVPEQEAVSSLITEQESSSSFTIDKDSLTIDKEFSRGSNLVDDFLDVKTFSQSLKEELLAVSREKNHLEDMLAMSLMTAADFLGPSVRFSLAYTDYVVFLADIMEELFGVKAHIKFGKGLSILRINDKAESEMLRQFLKESYSFDALRGRISDMVDIDEPERCKSLLRALFLSAGSMANPKNNYHLEMAIRRLSLANFSLGLFEAMDINAHMLKRYGANIIYIKDGDGIADFLSTCSASVSLLSFEAIRVERIVKNNVNRVVNCDTANANRIASSSARQIAMLEELASKKSLESLPENLLEVAKIRMKNPGLSIGQLAQKIEGGMSKSGMYHRLKRLEEEVAKLLCP